MKFNLNIQIGDKMISRQSPVFVIGEAGVNHCGNIEIAKKLIDLAADAGVDAVKFQAFKADQLILNSIEKAPYQRDRDADQSQTQHDMLRSLEMTSSQNVELQDYCASKGILFLTTPFEEISLDLLDGLDLPAYKIASTDLTNLPFLERVAKKNKPILLSTGMSYFSEIEAALNCINQFNRDVILLHCTANYPINDDEVNLNVINKFNKFFDMLIGFSDHTIGVGASIFSVPMGVKVIEKHFTLDRNMAGPDHLASLSPGELHDFVKAIRKVEEYMGSDIKIPTLSEVGTRKALQKCFVASTDISAGELFTSANLVAKRTGGVGISPIYANEIFGQSAKIDFKKDEVIKV